MANQNRSKQDRAQIAADRNLSQEDKWKSFERSFDDDFIKKVKRQHDGAERLQMA
jgi:hypothetical protein